MFCQAASAFLILRYFILNSYCIPAKGIINLEKGCIYTTFSSTLYGPTARASV